MVEVKGNGGVCLKGVLMRTINASDQPVATEKAEAAKQLAKRHYDVEAGLTKIFRLTGTADVEVSPLEPIKLLEVNTTTASSGIMPLHFGAAPSSGIPFPSIIVEVTPDEFEKIQTQELKLPEGWRIAEEFRKPTDDDGVG